MRNTEVPSGAPNGETPSIRSRNTFTDSRATASRPGAMVVSDGVRYCESSELSKPITEMSSGTRNPCSWIECMTPEASMSFNATTPSGTTPESSSIFMAYRPSSRCHIFEGTTNRSS